MLALVSLLASPREARAEGEGFVYLLARVGAIGGAAGLSTGVVGYELYRAATPDLPAQGAASLLRARPLALPPAVGADRVSLTLVATL